MPSSTLKGKDLQTKYVLYDSHNGTAQPIFRDNAVYQAEIDEEKAKKDKGYASHRYDQIKDNLMPDDGVRFSWASQKATHNLHLHITEPDCHNKEVAKPTPSLDIPEALEEVSEVPEVDTPEATTLEDLDIDALREKARELSIRFAPNTRAKTLIRKISDKLG